MATARCQRTWDVYTAARVLILVQDLDIRIINAATGQLLRELIPDPTSDYDPTGGTKGPQTEKVPNLMQVRNYSDVLRHHTVGQVQVRTCVGVSRRI